VHVDGGERFVVAWKRSAGGTLNAVAIDGGVIGPEVAVSDRPVLQNPSSTQSKQPVAALAGDERSGTVHAVYADEEAWDLHRDALGSAGTWGTDESVLQGVNVASIQASVLREAEGDGAADVLGIIFDDDIGFDPATEAPDNVPYYMRVLLP